MKKVVFFSAFACQLANNRVNINMKLKLMIALKMSELHTWLSWEFMELPQSMLYLLLPKQLKCAITKGRYSSD